MSLLLDALNKADEERKRHESPPSIGSNHDKSYSSQDNGRKLPVFAIAASSGVLVAILLVVVFWLGRHTPISNTAETTSASNIQITQQPQAVNTSDINTAKNTTTPEAKTNAVKPKSVAENPSEESVSNLYQQNIGPQAAKATTVNNNARPIASAAPAATPAVVTSIKQFANLPDLHDLPNAVLEKIPSLNYSEHHYNANGGSVVINGSVRHAEDSIANGLVIDKILEDGMILHIDNYSFKMRALNSWVNM